MSQLLQGLKKALVAGLLVVLPAWLAVLLIVGLLTKLGIIVKPIAGQLPEGVNHPQIVAIGSFLLVCLFAGCSCALRWVGFSGVFSANMSSARCRVIVPLRTIANQFADLDKREGFKPSLVEVEDGSLAPAFLIERHDDGRCTVSFLRPHPDGGIDPHHARGTGPRDRRAHRDDPRLCLEMGHGSRGTPRRDGVPPAAPSIPGTAS